MAEELNRPDAAVELEEAANAAIAWASELCGIQLASKNILRLSCNKQDRIATCQCVLLVDGDFGRECVIDIELGAGLAEESPWTAHRFAARPRCPIATQDQLSIVITSDQKVETIGRFPFAPK